LDCAFILFSQVKPVEKPRETLEESLPIVAVVSDEYILKAKVDPENNLSHTMRGFDAMFIHKVVAVQKNGAPLAQVEAKGEGTDGEQVLESRDGPQRATTSKVRSSCVLYSNFTLSYFSPFLFREFPEPCPTGNVVFAGDQVAFYVDRSRDCGRRVRDSGEHDCSRPRQVFQSGVEAEER